LGANAKGRRASGFPLRVGPSGSYVPQLAHGVPVVPGVDGVLGVEGVLDVDGVLGGELASKQLRARRLRSYGHSGGTFEALPWTFSSSSGVGNPPLMIADIDGDGCLDVVVASIELSILRGIHCLP
jgi:hypothetical protein